MGEEGSEAVEEAVVVLPPHPEMRARVKPFNALKAET